LIKPNSQQRGQPAFFETQTDGECYFLNHPAIIWIIKGGTL
jgi:hypothetical protein